MKGTPTWIAVVLLLAAVVAGYDDWKTRGQIRNAKTDTIKTTKTITLKADPVVVETTQAYLSLKKALRRSAIALARTESAKTEIAAMYEKALRDTGSLALPTAVLDTAIQRRNSTKLDTIHTEYVFPPVNAFVNTRISLAPFDSTITDTSYTKTIPLSPSLWVTVRDVGIGVGIGAIVIELLHYLKP